MERKNDTDCARLVVKGSCRQAKEDLAEHCDCRHMFAKRKSTTQRNGGPWDGLVFTHQESCTWKGRLL